MAGNSGQILGWEQEHGPAFGFERKTLPPEGDGRLIRYAGDGHLLAIAPTGAGKGRDFIIPILLDYPGQVVVLDPKGELAAVTARRRQELGHSVIKLDPFAVLGQDSDRLNPLDIFDLPGSIAECDAEMLASQLSTGHEIRDDPFWSDSACGIVSGLIAHLAAGPKEKRHLSELRSYFYDQDMAYLLANMIDSGNVPDFAREEFISYIHIPTDKTRPGVHATAMTFLKALGSGKVASCLESSSFSLGSLMEGCPLSIFIIVPPEKFHSHRALIRLWVATLFTAILRRRILPAYRTLFLLDEAAQLEHFPPLLTAATLMRGYGLQLLTIWQDLAQLRSRYPKDWQTILNNAGVLAAFGFANYGMARDWADLLGLEPNQLLKLKPDEAALHVRGEGSRTIRRLNYLRDPLFRGQFDPNPYHAARQPDPLSR